MRFLAIPFLLALFLLTGCKKSPDIAGKWNFPLPQLPMQLDFKRDGTYAGTAMGGAVQVAGKYNVKGKVLSLDAPQMSGAAGSLTPSGGQMRLEMKPLDANSYALSAPGINITMTRMGPPQ